MQEIKRRLSFSDVLMIIIIASLTFMFIPAWIPFLRRGWQLLVFATIIILLNKYHIPSRAFIALLLYEIILILNVLTGDVYFGSVTFAIYEFLVLFVPFSLALYCTKDKNKRFVRSLVYITFIALLVEFVASFIVLETNPGIIRSLYLESKKEDGLNYMYGFYKLGIMDYAMGHAIPILIPPLFCNFKVGTRKEKWICLLLMAVCIFLIWLSESATALLLMTMLLIMGFIVNNKRTFKDNVFIISFVALVAVIFLSNNNIMTEIFDISERLVENDPIYSRRIEDLRLSFMEDQTTGDMKSRTVLYGKSAELFFSNIFLGSNQMPGRHSGVLDRLAALGLVGFIPMMLFFIFGIKAIWVSIPKNRKIYYLECIIAAFLMLLFKAMWLWPIFLFLFVISPCMLIMKQDEK